MKKYLLFTILFVIAATLFILPLKYHGQYWMGFIWCKPNIPYACPHEVAHYSDEEMGYPSATKEFKAAVEGIGLTMWSTPSEVYAELYTIAQGEEDKMPEALRGFYDWDLAEELLRSYE